MPSHTQDKQSQQRAFTQKMKEMDMQERGRAMREKNDKRRKLLEMGKEKGKDMDKEIQRKQNKLNRLKEMNNAAKGIHST